MDKCEVCKLPLIQPAGRPDAPLYLFGPYPGKEEINRGIPWCGPAGEVLKSELLRAGIAPQTCRLSNIWLHGQKKDPTGEHVAWMMDQLLADLKYAKAVLIMGSLSIRMFLDRNVIDCNGLKVKSKWLPKNIKVAYASYNPAQVLIGTVGEFRLAVKRFAMATKEYR